MTTRERGFGWRKDPDDPNDRIRGPRPGLTRVESVRFDHLSGAPLDQLWASACVGFSCVELLQLFYAIMGMLIGELSPWHAYWIARAIDGFQHEDAGAFIRSCLRAMQHVGCSPAAMYPFAPEDIDSGKINLRPPDSAENSGIKFADFRTERIVGGPEAALDSLQLRRPFVLGTDVTDAFVNCRGEETIPAPKAGDRRRGGHAFLVLGFDRFGSRLLAKNSWGSEYGFGGYMWLDPEWINDRTTQDVIAITTVKEAA